jgi:hypothetical protein
MRITARMNTGMDEYGTFVVCEVSRLLIFEDEQQLRG